MKGSSSKDEPSIRFILTITDELLRIVLELLSLLPSGRFCKVLFIVARS
jgi:hypothetical protein